MANFERGKPRRISFTLQGEELSPQQVFDALYTGLEDVVHLNLNSFKRKNHADPQYNEPVTRKVAAWRQTEPANILAEIMFDDTSKKMYEVRPRSNFDSDMLKLPNIACLQGQDGSVLILREARKYPLDTMIAPIARRRLGKKFDYDSTAQFYGSSKTPAQIGAAKNGGLMVIPEPHLLIGLERIYSSTDLGRVTPPFSALASNSDKLWYIRGFFPLLRDTSAATEKLGYYFGKLQALGLMEILDRQLIHYCLIGNNIGNYDPDFISHSMSPPFIIQKELSNIRSTIQEDGQEYPFTEPLDEYLKYLKPTIRKTRERYQDMGITPAFLLPYLPQRITTADLPALELSTQLS